MSYRAAHDSILPVLSGIRLFANRLQHVMSLQGFTETDRWFDVAVKVAKEFMKSHIISSDSDRIAVVFYGSVSPDFVVLRRCDADSQ